PDRAQRREEHDRMLGMLRRLPEEYGVPITLRYIAGADYDTIGRQLGLSNGSLRGLLNRGMAKLRELMGATSERERGAGKLGQTSGSAISKGGHWWGRHPVCLGWR